MKILFAFVISLYVFAGTLSAVPIPFDLRDRSTTAEIVSGAITRGGVTATLTPIVSGSTGALNQTASAFGINASTSDDDTDTLDGGAGAESISLLFNTDIVFTQLGLSLLSAGESASLTIDGFASIPLSDTGVGSDIFSYASNNLVLTGQTVLLSWIGGNGFSFDNFTIDTDVPPTTVPESGTTLAFLGLGVFGLILFRRFRC